jgi:nicotinamide-nucleotide amidase
MTNRPVRLELVSVGDELLRGDLLNANAAWLGDRLSGAGFPVSEVVTAGDDVDEIAAAVLAACARAEVVVLTGGLGPTSDDLTREGLAAAAAVPLLRDADIEDELKRWYTERDLAMPSLVLRQADVPEGATVITNPRGSAPGLRMQLSGAVVYALPGVPLEMTAMAEQQVLPEIASRFGQVQPSSWRVVRVALESEPVVGLRLAALGVEGIRIGYLAEPGEVRVRLTGRDAQAVARTAQRARELLGPAAFTEDDDPLDAVVHRLLAARDATLAVAESLTGGLLAATLTSAAGASATFRGGLTAYATDVKGSHLGVDKALLAAEGPVDPDVARQMASGVRERFAATYGLATTGVAGPETVGERPVGTVFVAMAGPHGRALATRRLTGDRDRVRRLSVIHALDLLRRHLAGLPPYDPGDEIGA